MKLLKFAPLVLIAALGGCSELDWDHLTSYVGLGPDNTATPPPEQAPPADSTSTTSAPPSEQSQPWTPVGAGNGSAPVSAAPEAAPQSAAAPAAAQTSAPTATEASAPPAQAVASAPESSPAPAANSWCQDVAKTAASDAASQGFDEPTQRHRAATAYEQCVRYGH